MSTLYLVATPIGDPDDLSPRAARCLAEVDVIAAEDTRVAKTLLRRLGLSKRLVSYHAHNEDGRTPQLLAALAAGQSVALIPDQGTPLVSDPGFRLVQDAAAAGVRIVPIPGPSAALAALVVAGFPIDRFLVVGFLPRRSARRKTALAELRSVQSALVFFEAPHRIAEMLHDASEVLGARRAVVGRNLTKADEDIRRGTLAELFAGFSAEGRIYGELTVVVAAPTEVPQAVASSAVDLAIARLLEAGVAPRAIRDVVADLAGLPRSGVYARVLELSRAGGETP
jgi:16S rRNA (cytidine1402-2'-O)-methyltransferase